MARPPKPTVQKKLQGTLKKCRENKDEPTFPKLDKNTKPPAYFSKHSRGMWASLLKEWEKQPITETVDIYAFEMLCASYGAWRESAEALSKDASLLENETHGGQSALVQQMNKNFAMCEKMMSRFGLTPSDRNRLGLSKKQEIDPDTQKMRELIGA